MPFRHKRTFFISYQEQTSQRIRSVRFRQVHLTHIILRHTIQRNPIPSYCYGRPHLLLYHHSLEEKNSIQVLPNPIKTPCLKAYNIFFSYIRLFKKYDFTSSININSLGWFIHPNPTESIPNILHVRNQIYVIYSGYIYETKT